VADVESSDLKQRTGDRRQRRDPIDFPDRRTGFDRRLSYPFIGPLRNNQPLLLTLLATLNLLSLLDIWVALLEPTRATITTTMALFGIGAMLLKLLVVLGISLLVWSRRQRRRMLLTATALLVLGGIFFLAHLGFSAISPFLLLR
jgi:hypothetical protein